MAMTTDAAGQRELESFSGPEFVSLAPGKLADLGRERHAEYVTAEPFPHIALDEFFDAVLLREVLNQTPSLARGGGDVQRMSNENEEKLASVGELQFGPLTAHLMRYLNSEPFLHFLEELTGIRNLIPDPHFEGGGHHEILPGGFLKVHADFNRHGPTGLDRRLNALVYLNQDWREGYGGHLELWDREMTRCVRRILPVFNRLVVFTTTSNTFHGHPEPLRCPQGMSRKSLALYYYTNGRPPHELESGQEAHSTLFRQRPGTSDASRLRQLRSTAKRVIKAVTPPIVVSAANRLRGS